MQRHSMIFAWRGSAVSVVPRRRKRGDRAGTPELAQSSPRSRWLERYVHFQRGKCSSEGGRTFLNVALGKLFSSGAARLGSPMVMSPIIAQGGDGPPNPASEGISWGV